MMMRSRIMAAKMLLVLLSICMVSGYPSRSYELPVPGSKPIRIIEADPYWDPLPQIPHRSERRHSYGSDVEHRASEVTTTPKPDQISDRQDVDYDESSHKLKDFLDNYAENLRRRKPEEEMYLRDEDQKQEKSKAYYLVNKHHPYDEDKGWVSMEAVPWSMSKISKWQRKPQIHNFQQSELYGRPSNDDYAQEVPQKPQSFGRPRPIPKPPSYADDDEEEVFNNNKKRPSFPRPSAIYGQKVHIQPVGDYETGKPWKRPHRHDTSCKNEPEIITDGLPADFPDAHHNQYMRRKGTGTHDLIPSSHPFKGDVLPPLKNGKVNMTTSHGGLLQVESTFQSVDEAQKAYAKRQRLKIRPNTRKPLKLKPSATTNSHGNMYQQKVSKYEMIQAPESGEGDATSMMAAVGAGMIPAGMALLVPMAMNGRKRRDLHRFVTSSPYSGNVEITLPRSF